MAESKDEMILRLRIETDKANAALAKTEVEIKKTVQSFKKLTKGSLEYQAAQAKLAGLQTKYAQQSTVVNKKMENSLVNLNKELDGSTQASGAATTSVLELGRVVSDAPYGIRGMANNVSQLASNMLFGAQQIDKATGKAIGFTGVIKSMGKAFIGPLGILFAIQAVVAAVDFFYGGMKKAEEKSKELSNEVGKTAGEFRRLNVILRDGRISLEDRTEALRKLKKEYPEAIELIKSYEDNLKTANNTIDDSIELEKAYTKVIIAEAKKRGAKKLVEEKSAELYPLEDKRNQQIEEQKRILLGLGESYFGPELFEDVKDIIKTLESEFDVTKGIQEQSDKFKAARDKTIWKTELREVSNFTKALFVNQEKIAELNKEIERAATDSVDFNEQKRKEAEELAKQLRKLSINELEEKIAINEIALSDEKALNQKSLENGTTINEEKIKLMEANFNMSEVIIKKKRDSAKEELGKEGSDLVKRQNIHSEANQKLIKLQQKYYSDLEALEAKDKVSVKKLSPFKTPKELQIDVKNGENAIIQYEKKIEESRLKKELNDKLSEAKSEEERRKIREEYQLKRLQNQLDAEKKMLELKLATEKIVVNTKRDNHIDDLKRATDLYIHKVKLNDKLSAKEKEQMIGVAKSQLQIATNQANTEADGAITEIKDKYQTLFGFFDKLSIARKDALTSGFGEEEPKVDPRIAKMEAFVSKYMEISGVLTDFMNGEFEREMTIEQNKTNALNNELRERLNNESLSAGERKSIQLEIARNDEELRKKQEQIQKKQFKMQKAANIANALVNTYASASKAFQNSISNPINKLLPDGGLTKAKISAGVATAFGLANVAMIARQKFQSSAGATVPAGSLGAGGGSGSGTGDRSFNFNLAGASQENQLAQTLQGRFDQPLQAYVVSRDITNQQQLDLDIENNASFG